MTHALFVPDPAGLCLEGVRELRSAIEELVDRLPN
jgi:hypothetical protein